jgi:hypothetical protein
MYLGRYNGVLNPKMWRRRPAYHVLHNVWYMTHTYSVLPIVYCIVKWGVQRKFRISDCFHWVIRKKSGGENSAGFLMEWRRFLMDLEFFNLFSRFCIEEHCTM